MSKRVGVGGILLNERREVLMVRRGATAPRFPNAWTIPTGMVDPGEEPRGALAREMREELGVVFEPDQTPCHIGIKSGVEIRYYLGTWAPEDATQGIVLKPSPKGVMENDEFAFVPIDEAIRRGKLHDFVFVGALKALEDTCTPSSFI